MFHDITGHILDNNPRFTVFNFCVVLSVHSLLNKYICWFFIFALHHFFTMIQALNCPLPHCESQATVLSSWGVRTVLEKLSHSGSGFHDHNTRARPALGHWGRESHIRASGEYCFVCLDFRLTLTADDILSRILFRFWTRKKQYFFLFLKSSGIPLSNLGPDCEEIKCLLKTGGSLPGSRSITMDCLENSWKYFIFTQGPGSISNIIAGEIKYLLECTTPGPVLIIYWLDAFLQCLCLCSGSHSFLSLRSEIVMHFSLFTYSKLICFYIKYEFKKRKLCNTDPSVKLIKIQNLAAICIIIFLGQNV